MAMLLRWQKGKLALLLQARSSMMELNLCFAPTKWQVTLTMSICFRDVELCGCSASCSVSHQTERRSRRDRLFSP
jgi:hypothetical protein